jgi:hypothetical protein
MNDLKHTIEQARAKGMDDDAIKNLLVKAGWDDDIVSAALKGIFIPKPPAAENNVGSGAIAAPSPSEHAPAPVLGLQPVIPVPPAHSDSLTTTPGAPTGPKLSALEAALHHVLLWFFTLSMSITIGVMAATIFGTSQSIEALTTFLATSTVTLLAFGFFYGRYLRRLRSEPALTTNRVWTIITIVLHSVGAMGALITLIAVGINSTGDSLPVMVAALTIAILDALVVAVYVNATFVHAGSRPRLLLIKAFPILILLLLVGFMVASIMKVGPLRTDDRTRHDLVTAVEKIRRYVSENQALPANGQSLGLPAGVEYERKTKVSYNVCANFTTKSKDAGFSYDSYDSYVGTSEFMNDQTGRQCFTLKSQYLVDNQNSLSNPIIKGLTP